MTLEATLERIAVALETIAKNGGTLAQVTAELGKPDAATPAAESTTKGTRGKKAEAAAAPAPAAAPAAEGPTWADTLAKIQLVNKGTAAGQGREGVIGLMKAFGLDPSKGDTVPKLQGLNKNAEIVAYCDKLLNPAPAAEADLGI